MSAMMNGGKNSLSIYRANILIFRLQDRRAGQCASTIKGFTKNSDHRGSYGLTRVKKSCYLLVASYR